MKKILLLVALLVATSTATFAQDAFRKGDNILALKVGFGSYGVPVSLTYERGIIDNIFNVSKLDLGVGGEFGFRSYGHNYGFNQKYNYTDLAIAAKGAFHYEFVRNLDTYAGLALGAQIGLGEYNASGLYFSAFVGTRYWLSKSWALGAEFGYGLSYGSLGVSYRF